MELVNSMFKMYPLSILTVADPFICSQRGALSKSVRETRVGGACLR